MSLILSGTDGLSDVDGSAATPAIRGTDANTGIFFPSADTIGFSEGGAEVARFDSSGNLGLGATPSAWSGFRALDVGSRSALVDLTSAQQTDIWSNAYFNGTNSIYKTTANASIYRQTTGQHIWFNAPSGTAGNAITFTQAMTLDASGNLGIGITSPNSYANYKTLSIFGTNGGELDMGDGTTTRLNLYSSSTSVQLSAVGAIPLVFNTNSAERARIDSSGNLLVGTTSQSGRATIKGSTSNGTSNVLKLVDSADADIMAMSTAGDFYLPKMGSSTGTTVVLTSGNYLVKSSSSIRYKKDVEPIDIGLNFILGLNPVKYKLKEDDIDQVGFIAEDFPDARLVSESMIDPQDKTKGFQREGVLYAQIVAPLVKAIQEQQALITQLQADVAALKGA